MTVAPVYEARREQMFPRLAEAQIARVVALGQRRAVKEGELLFDRGPGRGP
jgi:hypothetical protein